MAARENGFASAVVYCSPRFDGSGLSVICSAFAEVYENYELVIVYDGPSVAFPQRLKSSIEELSCAAISIVYMGTSQGMEQSMCAGLDASVGDWVYEIDDPSSFDESFVARGIERAHQGYDVVIGETSLNSGKGKLFYPLFNRFNKAPYKLATNSCSLASRRAVNRVRSFRGGIAYRKAAYAGCGLPMSSVPVSGRAPVEGGAGFGLAMDALALYTDAFYRMAFGLSVLMAALSLAEIVYVLAWFFLGETADGWTTTVFAMTLGFFGLFCILTFVLKYLSLLLRMRSDGLGYQIEGVDRMGT